MKLNAPATERNRDAIAGVLARWLPPAGTVLEVASGTGEHAAYFARRFPGLGWQPSDPDPEARSSIDAWAEEAALPNLLTAVPLDAGEVWSVGRANAIVCINMVHISPWTATLGLIDGAAKTLKAGAPLILYGPYRQVGVATAPSNEAFDASLRARDPAWALRFVEDVEAVAVLAFALEETVVMPANNLMLLFRRTGPACR